MPNPHIQMPRLRKQDVCPEECEVYDPRRTQKENVLRILQRYQEDDADRREIGMERL